LTFHNTYATISLSQPLASRRENKKQKTKYRKAIKIMGAHGKQAQRISDLHMFLTNGKGYGPVDPKRLAEWNNFVKSRTPGMNGV
jgi:hypothetical protein